MKHFTAVASVIAVAGSIGALVAPEPAAAVVNGAKVDPGTVPWFVKIGSCGGTLVTPIRVLTAAHCVRGRPPADLGALIVGGKQIRFTHIAMHPNWRHANGSNELDDVAIAELSAPIPSATTVQLATIATVEPADAWILGRGRAYAPGSRHSEAEALDASLRIAPLRSLADAECAALFRGKLTADGERFDRRMRCSIDADGKAPLYSGCFGDSGGPLFTGTVDAPVQLGVVSWGGDRCGADHLPSVFADVALYRDFILGPSPTWGPSRTGRVSVDGPARPGAQLRCRTHGYTPEPGARIGYEWKALRPRRVLARTRDYAVRRADRGHRVACFVTASNRGGQLIVGFANRLVR